MSVTVLLLAINNESLDTTVTECKKCSNEK
jgi:hypothetical protein